VIVTVVIFLAFEAASMPVRLGAIRETRPHIADGLANFATSVPIRRGW
jgi:AI-2 transport protein TqsA